VLNTQVNLTSFSADGQTLTISATRNTAGNELTGTYTITGTGCATGDAGTIAGTLYEPLTGTYQGAVTGSTPTQYMQFALTQATQGDGNGLSFLSGFAALQGFSCFTGATLSSTASYVLGSAVTLSLTANDPSLTPIVATGTFDAAADTITLSSINVTSGDCSGSLGPTTLTLAPSTAQRSDQ
jgi:hypothetical protein